MAGGIDSGHHTGSVICITFRLVVERFVFAGTAHHSADMVIVEVLQSTIRGGTSRHQQSFKNDHAVWYFIFAGVEIVYLKYLIFYSWIYSKILLAARLLPTKNLQQNVDQFFVHSLWQKVKKMEAIKISVNKQMDGYTFSITPSIRELIKSWFPNAHPANYIFVGFDTKSDFEVYSGLATCPATCNCNDSINGSR